MITGYNLPHLAQFSRQQLQLLANTLPKGLAYRLYGGEESQYYTLDSKMVDFIRDVEGRVILVEDQMTTDEQFEHVIGYQFDNEPYLFDPPTLFNDFWGWVAYTFNRGNYYRNLALQQINTLISVSAHEMGNIIVSLPLKVNQNGAYRVYAETWLNSSLPFEVDLHVFGGDVNQLVGNLRWYKQNTNRKIHFLEFNGLENDRTLATVQKNTAYHQYNHAILLMNIREILVNQCGEILYFTLAANETSLNWRNPPYLHKYEVSNVVVNTIPRVMP